MGPLPKRKHSRSRRNRRRAHDSLSLKHLVRCENCGEYHVAHHLCPNCGTYHGETRVEVETK
ncbi:MAG: 50S ribosomal protein L32 [Anaerolinea sp.]|nr:50S ribosomal protein L32 [Anaerolinea sp.]